MNSASTERKEMESAKRGVFFCALSDPLTQESIRSVEALAEALKLSGFETGIAGSVFQVLSPEQKAGEWNTAVKSGKYRWILDVSGGNLANLCLPYMDLAAYGRSCSVFAGFSDLSCLLNACLAKSGRPVLLYPALYQSDAENVEKLLRLPLTDINRTYLPEECREPEWIREASFAGGNIRCFLKLAGTPWFPDLKDKVLVLEGMGTSVEEFLSLMAQLKEMGVFRDVRGVLFGCFSRIMQIQGNDLRGFFEQALHLLDLKDLSWTFDPRIGHIRDCAPLLLGQTENRTERMKQKV